MMMLMLMHWCHLLDKKITRFNQCLLLGSVPWLRAEQSTNDTRWMAKKKKEAAAL